MNNLSSPNNGEMDGETEKTSQPIPPLLQAKKRKLVLHLDLNNTILVSDAATGQGPGAALNSYLTTVAWGQFSESGEWRWLEDCLSVMPPSKDAISYYTQFGRCSDFVDTQLGKRFKDVHAHHMQLLEWEGEADKVFAQTGEDGKRYNWILPSFFYLVESLYKQGRRFSVILRTFGTDLPLVLQAVHSAFMGKHPHLPHLRSIPITVDQTLGRIRCSKREAVLTRGPDRISTKAKERNLYDYFSSMNGIGGFQDHFDWWARNSFSSTGGKPFWINPGDCDTQHIIIDDNIRPNEEDSIVNCRMLLEKDNGRESRAVPTSELHDICLVPTDLLRAIAEKDYFLNCVTTCEDNYERYLSELQSE